MATLVPPLPAKAASHFDQPIGSFLSGLGCERTIWSISPEASVFDAIEIMTTNNIAALVVLSAQKLDGMIAQEDCTREVMLHRKSSRDTRVREVMTRGVYYANPEDTVEECMRLMTAKQINYLPVLEGNTVVGMLSSDDLNPRPRK